MRIPKKKELLELQKKYRTDKKIGEVYGVPSRLVTYWRTKKKIAAYSFPKYTEEKIRELWERFGDDARSGEELGISKAGYRQWRRKYQIDNKPLQLRLEQLELALPDSNRRKGSRRETIAQKILAKKSGLKRVDPGEVVSIEPDLAISSANSGQIINHFTQLGADKIWDPSKVIIVLDHQSDNRRNESTPSHKSVREFVKKQKIKHFFDIGQGISHQLIMENGMALPGQLVLSADSQSSAYGGLGVFSTSLTSSELAVVWATGKIWMRVPESIKIVLNGRLPRGVYAKDIMLKLTRDLEIDGAEYRAIELYGNAVSAMSISERFTLTSLSADIGFKSVMAPFDDVVARYLRRIIKAKFTPATADPDTVYCREHEIDINFLTPQAGSLFGNEGVLPIEEIEGKRVEQVVLGCCSNGRIDDLELAAKMLRGRHISHDLRMLVIPGSRKVLSEALEKGFIRTFIDSGCMVLNPSCGSCIDVHDRYLESGERAVTTAGCARAQNAGNHNLEIYQVSPATAVATALEGSIADPRRYIK
ncbi:MAG TPA: 3-isopropylmalate dehydratase large subunit [candidate division Zixibacteria bacterium]|nr:3-isopropylmalate dehydratase large subunit [candidate division Zixibacteria bacterium]